MEKLKQALAQFVDVTNDGVDDVSGFCFVWFTPKRKADLLSLVNWLAKVVSTFACPDGQAVETGYFLGHKTGLALTLTCYGNTSPPDGLTEHLLLCPYDRDFVAKADRVVEGLFKKLRGATPLNARLTMLMTPREKNFLAHLAHVTGYGQSPLARLGLALLRLHYEAGDRLPVCEFDDGDGLDWMGMPEDE